MEPACWSWPIPPLPTLEGLLAQIETENARLPRDERRDPRAAHYHMVDGGHRSQFDAFHARRCAVCACAVDRLVDDHHHASGLLRGRLCLGCNRAEGSSGHPVFEAYRRRPPAVILGYRKFYVGVGWPNRWWNHQDQGRWLTGDPDWSQECATLIPPVNT
jgi:hypothetical protein